MPPKTKLPDPPRPKSYEYLQKIRTATDLNIRPNPYIKDWVNFRYYQIIGIMHLLKIRRMVLGDGCGLGKTPTIIGTYSYLMENDPDLKMLVICPKSAAPQWVDEFYKFTEGIRVTRLINHGKASRQDQYAQFWGGADNVMVMHYHFFREDYRIYDRYMRGKRFVLVLDEATAVKTHTSKTHKVAVQVSNQAERCYGLTATLLKNNLLEGYGIYKVVYPPLFQGITKFKSWYTVQKKQKIGNRRIPIVVGYKNASHFRSMIDPFFIGRKKHEVSNELPDLISKEIPVSMTEAQWAYYGEALGDTLTIINKEGGAEEKEMTPLTRIAYFQQIVNSPALLGLEGGSDKEGELYRLLGDELEGEKVIIFSKFKKMVNILERELKQQGYSVARITGDEDEYQRTLWKLMFQEDKDALKRFLTENLGPDADPRTKRAVKRACKEHITKLKQKEYPMIMLLTPAGTEALNLQKASTFVFYDTPWSPGDYDQLLGRMIRIGSEHDSVLAIHLTCKGTIDDHIIRALKKKSRIINRVLGESTKGALDFDHESDVRDLLESLKEDALKFQSGGRKALESGQRG